MNYTCDSVNGVAHVDWDQDEETYLYMFLSTASS